MKNPPHLVHDSKFPLIVATDLYDGIEMRTAVESFLDTV